MKTNSLPDGCQRSLCSLSSVSSDGWTRCWLPSNTCASPAPAAVKLERWSGAPSSSQRFLECLKLLWRSVFFLLFSVLESCCSGSSPLQLLPPGAVDPASLTPVTPPTYISCSTPAATIITDMLPAWSLTPSVAGAVVFSQRARLATGLVLYISYISLYYPVIGYFLFSAILLFFSSLTPPLTFFSPLKVSAFFFFFRMPSRLQRCGPDLR